MLASPPTISQEDHDDDESEQSDSGSSTTSSSSSVSSSSTESTDTKKDSLDTDSEPEVIDDAADEPTMPIITQVMYENRNILNLAHNVWDPNRFIQFTVLPENNVNCFFQNRAQYWRLANNNCNTAHDSMEKCSCCDFSYPPIGQQGNVNAAAAAKNSITDSLMTFLKNNLVDYQNPVMSNPSIPMPPNRRQMYNNNNNNNNAPYAAYQMMQQQQQQQYQNNNPSGYYGNGGYNGQQQMNNGGGYNGTALALLNLMNASRNVTTSGAAFQATLNNSTRYFNNNMNTNNNGFGLYKQF